MISSAFLQLPDAPESPLPFHDAPKTRKSKPVNGKPQTMPTFPATTECHFTKPNTKSTTVQIERRARGVTVHLTTHYAPLSTTPDFQVSWNTLSGFAAVLDRCWSLYCRAYRD